MVSTVWTAPDQTASSPAWLDPPDPDAAVQAVGAVKAASPYTSDSP